MKKILLYTPLLLIVVVGIVQVILASNTKLNPWVGGGFGMFSSFQARVVTISGIKTGEKTESFIKYDKEQLYHREGDFDRFDIDNLRDAPFKIIFDKAIKKLREMVVVETPKFYQLISNANSTFSINGDLLEKVSRESAEMQKVKNTFTKIIFRIWKKRFNKNTKRLDYVLLKKEVVNI